MIHYILVNIFKLDYGRCSKILNTTLKNPVLNDHSEMDKTKVLMTNGGLMRVESIAECSLGAFCNTFALH